MPKTVPSTGAPLALEWKGPRPEDPVVSAGTTNAAQIIQVYCAPCHGPGLRGGLQRGLLDGKWLFAKDDEGVRRVISEGLGEKGMPAFGSALTPDQVIALIRYLRENQTTQPK